MVFGCSKDGATGATGATGNANVQSSSITVSASQWTYYSSNNTWLSANSAPLITTSIVNSGLVHAYMTTDSSIYYALPFNLNGINYSYNFSTGFIDFEIGSSNNTNLSSATLPATLKFRYVAAPSTTGKMNINWNNYEDVKSKLNLKE